MSKFIDRKFILSVLVVTYSWVSLLLKLCTFDDWYKIAGPVLLAYLGANLYQASKTNGNGKVG